MLGTWVLASALVVWSAPAWAQEDPVGPPESAAPVETAVPGDTAVPRGSARAVETVGPGDTAVPGESGAPTDSAESGSERRDLYLEMPYYLGGFEPDIAMTRGQDHFANLDAEDQARLELEGLLDAVGADIGDMVSGYALVSQEDFFSFVVAIRIEGVEPGSLMPAYLPILFEDLVEPSVVAGNVGGKNVVVIASLGDSDEYVDLFVYDQGDTLWMVQGPKDVVDATIENLPDPIGVE